MPAIPRLSPALLLTVLLAGCGNDNSSGTGPVPGADFPAGAWNLDFAGLGSGASACRLPSVVVTVTRDGSELRGQFESFGTGLCVSDTVEQLIPMGVGNLSGSFDGTTATIHFGPSVTVSYTASGTTLTGHAQLDFSFPNRAPITASGELTGSFHPVSSRAGVVEFVRIGPDQVTLGDHDSLVISSTPLDHNHQPLSHLPPIVYATSDSALATVDQLGQLHTGAGPGLFTITARFDHVVSQIVGRVTAGPDSLAFAPGSIGINRRSVAQVSVSRINRLHQVLSGGQFLFGSSDSTIATVSAGGAIAASEVNVGRTWIRVTSGSLTDSMAVDVVALPVHFEVSPATGVIRPDGHLQLTRLAADSAGIELPDTLITAQSGNLSLLTVSPALMVSGVGPIGFTTVIVSSQGVADTVRILVRSAAIPQVVDSITLTSGAAPYSVAVGPTGTMLIGDYSGHGVFAGQLPSPTLPNNVAASGSIAGVAITPDGARGFSANAVNNRVYVFNPATGQIADSILLSDANPALAIAVSPDGHTLAVSHGATVDLFDPATLAAKGTVIAFTTVTRLTFHPTLQRLYASAQHVDEIDLANPSVIRVIGALDFEFGAAGSAVSSDGTELYVADDGDSFYNVFDLGTGQLKQRILLSTHGLALSESQNLVYIAGGEQRPFVILDRASGIPVASYDLGSTFQVQLDQAGTTAVVPSTRGKVYLIR